MEGTRKLKFLPWNYTLNDINIIMFLVLSAYDARAMTLNNDVGLWYRHLHFLKVSSLKQYEPKSRYARFWLDLGRRLARLPDRPSTLDCGLVARRRPRTVLPPLPSPEPAAGLRMSSVHAGCLLAGCLPPVSAARPSPIHAPCPARQSSYYIQIQ